MKLDATFPALDLWRYEIRKGQRTTTMFDTLWAAACEEAAAREFCQDGIPYSAATSLRRSYDVIAQASRAA